ERLHADAGALGPDVPIPPEPARLLHGYPSRDVGGITPFRYDGGCCSNSSHDGMLTTRDRTPAAPSCSCAWTHRATSLPVPSSSTSGRSPSESASTYAPFATPAADA